jgi:hypothetical protein
MPRELAMHNIDMFTEKVMPSLSSVFSESPHNWWPKPVEGFESAQVDPVARSVRR